MKATALFLSLFLISHGWALPDCQRIRKPHGISALGPLLITMATYTLAIGEMTYITDKEPINGRMVGNISGSGESTNETVMVSRHIQTGTGMRANGRTINTMGKELTHGRMELNILGR